MRAPPRHADGHEKVGGNAGGKAGSAAIRKRDEGSVPVAAWERRHFLFLFFVFLDFCNVFLFALKNW